MRTPRTRAEPTHAASPRRASPIRRSRADSNARTRMRTRCSTLPSSRSCSSRSLRTSGARPACRHPRRRRETPPSRIARPPPLLRRPQPPPTSSAGRRGAARKGPDRAPRPHARDGLAGRHEKRTNHSTRPTSRGALAPCCHGSSLAESGARARVELALLRRADRRARVVRRTLARLLTWQPPS